MSRTTTRFGVYTSLLWTCGGLGSTTLPELRKSLISFGIFLIVLTHTGWIPFRPDGPEPPLRCRRFAYGYALDGFECPSYLVWPQRDGQFTCSFGHLHKRHASSESRVFSPLGVEHFYDSFALESQISVRQEALRLFGLQDATLFFVFADRRATARTTTFVEPCSIQIKKGLFGLQEDELLPDLHITRDGVLRIRLGAHQEHRVNHVARATDRTKVSADVIQLAAHEVDPAPERLFGR